jgi:hypothetical protein
MHIRFFTGCVALHVALRNRLRERSGLALTRRDGSEPKLRAETKNRPDAGGLTSSGEMRSFL